MKGFNMMVELKMIFISEHYAKLKSISTDDALRIFLASNTYQLLNDENTGLFLEVNEYVYDEFLEEMGDFGE